MKHLLFLFAVLFAVSACDGPNNFASIADKPPEESKKQSQGDYQKKITRVVEGEMKKKVGGKDRKTINISETVSKKSLDKKNTIITNVNVKSVIVEGKPEKKKAKTSKKKEAPKEKVVEKVRVVERVVEKVVEKKAAPPEKKLDILFYMHDRDTTCIRNVIAYSENKGFLKSLNHLNWQVSFSYYSQKKLAMLPLEWDNGEAHDADKDFWNFKEDYVLSKGEYTQKQADRLFKTTLTAAYPEAHVGEEGTPSSDVGLNTNPVLYWAVFNPLSGLDVLLSKKSKGSVRSDSHVVALLFGYDFPYYSSLEWKNFFNKHKNVSVIAVSYRSSNVSNFTHILEKDEYDFGFLPACDNGRSPAQIVQTIKNKVQ